MSAVDALRYRLATLRRTLFDRAGWRADVDEELAHHAELAALHGPPATPPATPPARCPALAPRAPRARGARCARGCST
jgi:hypothetical protein